MTQGGRADDRDDDDGDDDDDGKGDKGKEEEEEEDGDERSTGRPVTIEATPRSPSFTAFDREAYTLVRDGDVPGTVAWLMSTLIGTVQRLKGVPYRVAGVLGAGSSAVVFRATELETGRKRALKVFHTVCAPNWPDIEFHNACMFSGHGNTIVPVCIAGLSTSRGRACCIVTEHYEGGDLFEATRAEGVGGLGEKRAFRLFCQLLSVLFFMHERNVVHKDIKLENLVLEERDGDRIRVVDFGYAQGYVGKGPYDDGARYEEPDRSRSGSPHYCPYETFSGDAHHPTEPDMWAAFVCLYAMASGSLPFDTPDRGRQRQRQDDGAAQASTADERASLSMVIKEARLVRPRRRTGESVIRDELWYFLCAGLHHDRRMRLRTRAQIVREPWVVSMTARVFPQLSTQPSLHHPAVSAEPVDPFLSSDQLSSFRPHRPPHARVSSFHKSISLTRVLAGQQQAHCAAPSEPHGPSTKGSTTDRDESDAASWTLSNLTPISAKSSDGDGPGKDVEGVAEGRMEWGEADDDGEARSLCRGKGEKPSSSSWFSCFSFACRGKDE